MVIAAATDVMAVMGAVTAGEVVMILVVLHSDVLSGAECVYSAPCWLGRTMQTDPTLFHVSSLCSPASDGLLT